MAKGQFTDDQTTTVLTQVIETAGSNPSTTAVTGDDAIGFIRTFAFDFAPGGMLAQGQSLTIASNTALFAQIGTIYGGNGTTTFDLPNLNQRIAVGVSQTFPLGALRGADTVSVAASQFPASLGGTDQAVTIGQPAETLQYLIRVSGVYPTPSGTEPTSGFIGEVILFAGGGQAPDGFMVANGQTLSITSNPELFSLLGTTYGGDGESTFALPNLTGRTIVGTGTSVALGAVLGESSVLLTQADLPTADGGSGFNFNDQGPSLALNYIIATSGEFPSRGYTGDALYAGPYLGEVRAFAGTSNEIPTGWVLASGQTLSITSNTALFALLGTQYGGNGTTTFELPNLNDSTVAGSGTYANGVVYGANTTSLLVTDATPCYCPGTLILTANGETPVEDLRIGDNVITASGQHQPIKWLGNRSYAGRFLAANPNVQPIRFRAGSLGSGLPRRDLLVSPDHAMFLDGVLIPARCLVNGSTIVRDRVERVDYFHVELDSHDVLLAEGAPSESFMDDNSRGMFHNAAEYAALYPDALAPSGFCASRVESGRQLEAIRQRLVAIADEVIQAA